MTESIFAPRKIVRVNASSFEKAIDAAHDETNLFLYRITRDEKHLRFVPGETPARFTLVALSYEFATKALDRITDANERNRFAFRAACTRIEIPGEPEPMEPDPSKCVKYVGEVSLAGEEWERRVAQRFGMATVKEMGQVAWDATQLPDGAAGPFVWPPGADRSR